MRGILVAALFVAVTGEVRAQCPDGSLPPCRTAIVASAPRRVNPPLDDRTWIVVPFDNVAKAADADWLRAGSVNLLYLGLSRWTDIRVIDDERVADYMRDLPGASGASLSLNAGLAVAKRAGAGKLVMGDVLKLGNRTAVTAKVFDVRTGQRVRSVREEALVQDSVMPMFGKLAQRILNLAPPQGAGVGIVGTNSIAAYQEYAQGMQALNSFDMQRARRHLERALELDSTFALAHAKLSVLGGWITPQDPANRMHAEAAARLAAPLPPRERAIIGANVEFARRNYAKACDGFRALIRTDSTDTDAWYGLGDCLYHDTALEATDGDTTRIRFRANINQSMRAFRRVLELDPTYHLAYSHIVDQASGQFRSGQYCVDARCRSLLAIVRLAGDSLLAVPLDLPRDTALLREHLRDYLGTRRRILDMGRITAEQWVAANPAEDRARLAHATVLLNLGRIAEADSTLRRARLDDSSQSAAFGGLARLEIAIKLWRGAEALRLYDSVRSRAITVTMSPQGPITTGGMATQIAPVFGRGAEFDSLVRTSVRQSQLGPSYERFVRLTIKNMMGLPTDSLSAAERAVFDEISAVRGPGVASRVVLYSVSLGLRLPRATWPALDTASKDPRMQLGVAMMLKDTARLRDVTRRLDSISTVLYSALFPDTAAALVAAEGYLALRDSLSALRMTRRWLDSSVASTPLLLGGGGSQAQPLIPRAMVLRADLSAALGFKDEARVWYQRFLDFWAKSDPEFQPYVERVRSSLRALPP